MGLCRCEQNSHIYPGLLLDPGGCLRCSLRGIEQLGRDDLVARNLSSHDTALRPSDLTCGYRNKYLHLRFRRSLFSSVLLQVLGQLIACSMAAHFSAPKETRPLLCVPVFNSPCHLCVRGRQLFCGNAANGAKEGSGSISTLLSKFWVLRVPSLTATGSPWPLRTMMLEQCVSRFFFCVKRDAEVAPNHLSE